MYTIIDFILNHLFSATESYKKKEQIFIIHKYKGGNRVL